MELTRLTLSYWITQYVQPPYICRTHQMINLSSPDLQSEPRVVSLSEECKLASVVTLLMVVYPSLHKWPAGIPTPVAVYSPKLAVVRLDIYLFVQFCPLEVIYV